MNTNIEHRRAVAWGGVPGHCGIRCACGEEFGGRESIAAAEKVLDAHIADETVEVPA